MASDPHTERRRVIPVTEATFRRQVLQADLPVLVCFGARACPGRRALVPALARTAAAFQGRLLIADILIDRSPLLAEQYGVAASPTLMAFQHGDRQGQAIGYLPEGLLALFADAAARGELTDATAWSPVEERFEDTVLLPLISQWGFTAQRQVPCLIAGGRPQQRGRIDLLVAAGPHGRPITLIESKRQIRGAADLEQAAAQASAYAQSLALPSFVVAAPRGMWVYHTRAARAACVRHFTSLDLHQAPEQPRLVLLQLQAGA